MLCCGGTCSHLQALPASSKRFITVLPSVVREQTPERLGRELLSSVREQTGVTVKGSGRQGAAGGNRECGQLHREDGLKGRRREMSSQPPQGHTASPQPHTPALGAVLRSTHLSESPLGVLSPAAAECHPYATSPAECLALPQAPTRGLRYSIGCVLLLPLHCSCICLPGPTGQNPSGPRSVQALRRAGISECYIHSLRAALP